MKFQLKELVRVKSQDKADVIIGKKGLDPGVLNEIRRRLKISGIIKVKILKSGLRVTGLDRKDLAREVARRIGARLLEVRGRTFILVREDYLRDTVRGLGKKSS